MINVDFGGQGRQVDLDQIVLLGDLADLSHDVGHAEALIKEQQLGGIFRECRQRQSGYQNTGAVRENQNHVQIDDFDPEIHIGNAQLNIAVRADFDDYDLRPWFGYIR